MIFHTDTQRRGQSSAMHKIPILKSPMVEQGWHQLLFSVMNQMTEDAEKLLTAFVRLFNPILGTIVTHHLDTICITVFT